LAATADAHQWVVFMTLTATTAGGECDLRSVVRARRQVAHEGDDAW
jgi:hypothetical protein